MRGLAEFSGFLAAAVAAHVAIWQVSPSGAFQSSGQAGEGIVALSGADGALRELVNDWDNPPVASMLPSQQNLPLPVALKSTMADPAPDIVPRPPMAAPSLDGMQSATESLPFAESAPAAAPPDVSPVRSPRPPERPEPRAAPPLAANPARATQSALSEQPSGSGGGKAAGLVDTAHETPSSAAPDPGLMARWGKAIRGGIERRKRYPPGTHASGSVAVSIVIATNGALTDLGIARSSGDPVLDRAALEAVSRARLPSAPEGIPNGSHRFALSVSFAP